MPHEFTSGEFQLDNWRTDVRSSDFALITLGTAEEPLENPVLNAAEVFQQRHMVHCSALGLALDNTQIEEPEREENGGDRDSSSSSSSPLQPGGVLLLRPRQWPQPHAEQLLADLDQDVLTHMKPEAQQRRPQFVWLCAVPDEDEAASLGDNLRGYLAQQLEDVAEALPPAAVDALGALADGRTTAAAHPWLRHPSWPSDHALTLELAATHAAAAAGQSPAFCGDSPGGPLQFEFDLASVVTSYAEARGCAADDVQLAVLGTRQDRSRRQHLLVMCCTADGGLGSVFAQPLAALQDYNVRQQVAGGEVVAHLSSDGRTLMWWLQSTMGQVPPEEELTLPWKTFLNIDPGAGVRAGKESSKDTEAEPAAISVVAHSLGNFKVDLLEVALYFPSPGAELRLPVSRVRLRRGAVLRPCTSGTGFEPRPDEERLPAVGALQRLEREGVAVVAAPELVRCLREQGEEEVLTAIEAAGGIRKSGSSPCKQ